MITARKILVLKKPIKKMDHIGQIVNSGKLCGKLFATYSNGQFAMFSDLHFTTRPHHRRPLGVRCVDGLAQRERAVQVAGRLAHGGVAVVALGLKPLAFFLYKKICKCRTKFIVPKFRKLYGRTQLYSCRQHFCLYSCPTQY